MTTSTFTSLTNIQHPLEGISYLVIIAVIVRWLWPQAWNSFLRSVSAKEIPNSDENS